MKNISKQSVVKIILRTEICNGNPNMLVLLRASKAKDDFAEVTNGVFEKSVFRQRA